MANGAQGAPNRAGGPQSFATQPVAPQQPAGPGRQFTPVRGGVEGAGRPAPVQAPGGDFGSAATESARTLESLLSVGAAALEPALQRQEQQAYFNGVQRAVEGQTMAQILHDRPWYTRIFGDGALVEGARAYSVQKAVTDQATQFLRDLPKNRTRGTEDVMRDVTAAFDTYRTGDSATDAALLQQMTAALPDMIQQHTRAHYAWQQETALSGYVGAANSAGAYLQEVASRRSLGTLSEGEYERAVNQYISRVMMSDGMDAEAQREAFYAHVVQQAQAGNFHAVNTWKQTGAFDFLTPEQQISLTNAMTRYEAVSMENWLRRPENQLAEAQLRALVQGQGADMDTVNKMVNGFTTKLQQDTGIQQDPVNRSQLLATGYLTLQHEATRGATAQARALSKEVLLERVLGGRGGSARMGLEVTESDVQEARSAALRTPGVDRHKLMREWYADRGATASEFEETYKSLMATATAGHEGTAGFRMLYEDWLGLVGNFDPAGVAAAGAYFGDDYHARMSQFHRMVTAGHPVDYAYQVAVSEDGVRRRRTTIPSVGTTEYRQMERALDGLAATQNYSGWLSWFAGEGEQPLSEQAKNKLLVTLAPVMDEMRNFGGYTLEQSMGYALQQAVNGRLPGGGRLEMSGQHSWTTPPDSRRMDEMFPAADARLRGASFDAAISDALKKAGQADANVADLNRMPDTVDGAHWYVLLADDDGNPLGGLMLTEQEIKEQYDIRLEELQRAGARRRAVGEAVGGIGRGVTDSMEYLGPAVIEPAADLITGRTVPTDGTARTNYDRWIQGRETRRQETARAIQEDRQRRLLQTQELQP